MQFGPVVLKNYAEEDVTFSPRDITGGVATLVKSTGVPLADKRITFAQTRTTGNGRTKLNLKFTIPVVQDQVVAGVSRPIVVRTAYADLTMTFDQTSTNLERADIKRYLSSFLASTMGGALVHDLETLY